jgi:hypothetical protein
LQSHKSKEIGKNGEQENNKKNIGIFDFFAAIFPNSVRNFWECDMTPPYSIPQLSPDSSHPEMAPQI